MEQAVVSTTSLPAKKRRVNAEPSIQSGSATHSRADRRGVDVLRARVPALLIAGLVYAAAFAFQHFAKPTLTGDEPHYLVYATSLGRGWGVDLERAYQLPKHRRFFPDELEPHAERGRHGRLVTWHGPGLAALLAPLAVRPRGPEPFRAAMALIAALLAYHLFRLIEAFDLPVRAAAAGVLAVMLSPPAIYYSTQIYPEIVAGLLVILAFRALVSRMAPATRLAAAAAAATLLPWFNLRYLTLTFTLGCVIAGAAWKASGGTATRRLLVAGMLLRGAVLVGAIFTLSLVMFNLELYGALRQPPRVTAGYYRLENIYVFGFGGLMGLLPLAPVLIVAFAAIPMATRRLGVLSTMSAAMVAMFYCTFNGYFGSPGWSPPGRYLVSVVPLLALPLSVALALSGPIVRTVTAMTVGVSLLITLESVSHFDDLFTGNRSRFQIVSAIANLWPSIEEPNYGTLNQSASAIRHEVGRLEEMSSGSYLVAREGRDPPGLLAFGPYVPLRNGRYRAVFNLLIEASQPDLEPAQVEAVLNERVIAKGNVAFPADGFEKTSKVLEFESRGAEPAELRVRFHGRGILGIGTTSARLITELPSRDVTLEGWKGAVWSIGLALVAWAWYRATGSEKRLAG